MRMNRTEDDAIWQSKTAKSDRDEWFIGCDEYWNRLGFLAYLICGLFEHQVIRNRGQMQ